MLASGYVTLTWAAIDPADGLMFEQMCSQQSRVVFEHRWVKAKQLGRALLPNELVDHMDGNKGNNSAGNLRVYLKGKQEPGSAHSYGTYYDEWQVALARLRQAGLEP